MSGCFAKNGRNHLSSFGRIHVARFGIGKFTTSHCVCKEHCDVKRGRYHPIKRRIGNIEQRKQGSGDRSSAARSRERLAIFATRRSVVSCCKHDQSRGASGNFSRGRRGPASAG